MKMRLAVPGDARGAWLTVGRSAAGAVLMAVTVSACTGGGSSVPSIFTPTPETNGASSAPQTGTRAPSPTGQVSGSPGRSTASGSASGRSSASASGSPHASAPSSTASATHASAPASHAATPNATHTSVPATPVYPTAAPETGGGGTAGLQDGVLFGGGGLAVLAGIGSLAYRRRLARKLKANDPGRQSPAEREPADR